MRIRIALVIFLMIAAAALLAGGSGQAPRKVRVLFIGNSLTAVNNLPGLIEAIAEDRGQAVEWELSAPSAYRFSQHASFSGTLDKIKTGNWDYVVLQEQSQLPAFPSAQVAGFVFPYAERLCAAVRAASPRARVVFYETMGRRSGDTHNARTFPELSTYVGMQRRLNESYRRMAKDNRALLAPVGEVWQKVRAQMPSLNLYSDDTHPNMAGTYLTACVLYALFFNQSPLGLPHPPEVDNEIAVYLQRATEKALIHRGRFRLPEYSR